MEGDWISFPGLLRCWSALLLLPLALAWVWKFELPRPRSMLPALLLAGLWLQAPIGQLAEQCQTALLGSAPLQFFSQAFAGVLPS